MGWWNLYGQKKRSRRTRRCLAPVEREGRGEAWLIKVLAFASLLASAAPILVHEIEVLTTEGKRGCQMLGLCDTVTAPSPISTKNPDPKSLVNEKPGKPDGCSTTEHGSR